MPNITSHHPRIWNWSLLFLTIILSLFVFTVSSSTVHAGQVTLAWDRNAEADVAGYKVYYGTASRNYGWFIDVGDVTTITITDLTDGLMYYFAATAYDNASPPLESDYSGEVSKNMCTYSISPTSASFNVSGGTGSVSVATQPGCSWTASSGVSWITITSGSSGTGNGTVNYSVAANTGASRSAASTFATRVFNVNQAGATTYTITASAGTGGSINPSGSVSVAQGGNQTFSITANTGYQIAGVTVDGVPQGAISSYTFSNVTSNHTISASFSVRTYTITASAGAGGTISPSGAVSVNYGSNRAFTISANAGYTIANVLVDGASVGAVSSYTFTNVTANHTISASFASNTYTITASAGTGGTISPTGSVSVNYGANQTFTVSANTGYQVANVTVDGVPQGAISSYTFSNVTASHTISASFSVRTYAITASAGTGGTISPSGSVSVSHGSNQTFTITASTGYSIASVTVDGASVGAVSSYTFSNVTAAHTISATFTANTYTITASAGTGGTISPSGSVSVSHGSNQSFTITANTGYQVANVSVDGVSQGAINSYTFSNVTSNHTISASFSVRTYTITASAGTGGTISPSGSVSVNHGSNQTFTISANTGYTISSVTVDGVSQGTINSYSFNNVTAAHTISATFSAITYTITASAGTGGTISPSGAVSVNYGSNRAFTISANVGYTIADVLVDGASVGAVSSYTFSNVTANHTISASFSITTYTISSSAGAGGIISPSGSISVNHGANQTFTITPDTGYGVSNVLVDGVSVGAVGTYTFSNITAGHTISASFAVNTFTINATAGTGGTISPSGAVAVSGGSNQTFTITANTGYRIADVLVDGSSVGAVSSYTFTNVNSSHTISAGFAANTYTINASAGVGGTISPNGAVSVNHGANQTFTIAPSTGYVISNVLVDGSPIGAVGSYTFNNVTAGHTISATFTVRTYTLTSSAGVGGTISPSGSVSVNHGSNQTFTIAPNTGYGITNVVVDGTSVGAVSSYTFRNVTANHTISATFTLNSYVINASAGVGGTISPNGAVSVNHGANQTFTIAPSSGYVISSVLVDGVSQGALNSFTFSNVTTNHSISANFTQITYTIQTSAATGGTISPSGIVIVAHGANQTFMITADSGYVVSDVLVDGSSVGAVTTYTFTNVTSSHMISASFIPGYTLTVNTTGTGIGEVTTNPSATVFPPGARVTVRATKDVSSIFEGFSGDCTSTKTSCTIIMNKHANVAAAFKLKTLRIKTTIIGNGTVTLEEPVAVQNNNKTRKTRKVSKNNKSKHESNIDYGDQLVYTITPEPGNYIKKVWVDLKPQGSVESLTLAEIKRNHKVKVKFAPEAELPDHERTRLVKHQIFLRDNYEQDELQTTLADDQEENDDEFMAPSSPNQLASIRR